MRTKLLSSIVLGTMALAGVASADPYVRDHRAQPTITVQPAVSIQASFQAGYRAPARPAWQSQSAYGYQVSANGSVNSYDFGRDPRPEYIARNRWMTLGDNMRLGWNANHSQQLNTKGISLTTVELQAESGCSTVQNVVALLADGTSIVVSPSRNLDSHAPNLRVDFGPRARVGINKVLVSGTGDGTFRVIAG